MTVKRPTTVVEEGQREPETLEDVGVTTIEQLRGVIRCQGVLEGGLEVVVKPLPESWKKRKTFLRDTVGPDQTGVIYHYYLWWSGSRWLMGSVFL